MEENVNKAASWEDVLNDKFNEPQEVVEEQAVEEISDTEHAEQVGQVDQVIDQVTEQVTEQATEEVSKEVTGEATEQVIQDVVNISDLDPSKQALIDAILDGKEDLVYDYFVKKNTDYTKISDVDILRTKILADNPNWDNEDAELEIESKYGAALFGDKIDLEEIDKDVYPDEYKEAVKINKEIDRANKLLKRDAKETRTLLEQEKQNLALPVSERRFVDKKDSNNEAVNDELSQAEIERLEQEWIAGVERDVPSINEFKFKLGDEDVTYKITDDEKSAMVSKMKTFNAENYLVDRGWVRNDGTPDFKKIAEDVYILENNEKIFRAGWTQSKEKAKMDLISKDIKNINLESSPNTVDVQSSNPYAYGDFVLGL
jgi:hypothetical protein